MIVLVWQAMLLLVERLVVRYTEYLGLMGTRRGKRERMGSVQNSIARIPLHISALATSPASTDCLCDYLGSMLTCIQAACSRAFRHHTHVPSRATLLPTKNTYITNYHLTTTLPSSKLTCQGPRAPGVA